MAVGAGQNLAPPFGKQSVTLVVNGVTGVRLKPDPPLWKEDHGPGGKGREPGVRLKSDPTSR
jgi:hypothetical protein